MLATAPTLLGASLGVQREAWAYRLMIDVPAGIGPVPLIDVVLLGLFALTARSVAYVAWDAYRNNPELTIMKWGWVLVTLFLGPIGLFVYILSPDAGRHAGQRPERAASPERDHRRLHRLQQSGAVRSQAGRPMRPRRAVGV